MSDDFDLTLSALEAKAVDDATDTDLSPFLPDFDVPELIYKLLSVFTIPGDIKPQTIDDNSEIALPIGLADGAREILQNFFPPDPQSAHSLNVTLKTNYITPALRDVLNLSSENNGVSFPGKSLLPSFHISLGLPAVNLDLPPIIIRPSEDESQPVKLKFSPRLVLDFQGTDLVTKFEFAEQSPDNSEIGQNKILSPGSFYIGPGHVLKIDLKEPQTPQIIPDPTQAELKQNPDQKKKIQDLKKQYNLSPDWAGILFPIAKITVKVPFATKDLEIEPRSEGTLDFLVGFSTEPEFYFHLNHFELATPPELKTKLHLGERFYITLNIARGEFERFEIETTINLDEIKLAGVTIAGSKNIVLSFSVVRNNWNMTLRLQGSDDALVTFDTEDSRQIAGLFFALAPLFATLASGTESTQFAALGATLLDTLKSAKQVFNAQKAVIRGIELVANPELQDYALVLDAETELSLDVSQGLKVKSSQNLKIRSQSIRLNLSPLQFEADMRRSFSLDLSDPGLFEIGDAFKEFFQIRQIRIEKQSGTGAVLQIGVGTKVDLGIVHVDDVTVKINLQNGLVTPAAMRATLDLAGTFRGSGYLKLTDQNVEGQIDLALLGIGLRIQAGLKLATIQFDSSKGVAVLVSLQVQFPGGIPLGSSGLGITGFLGLLATNYERAEDPPEPNKAEVPALIWYKKANGDLTKTEWWRPKNGAWAFGVGTVIGTLDGGFLLNLKGVFILELPGPRAALLMYGQILSPLPALAGRPTEKSFASVYAALEITPEFIAIGLLYEEKFASLVEISVPVGARFSIKDPVDFQIDLGTFIEPVKVKTLGIEASGYLMIHGKKIERHPILGDISGFAIALGADVALIWGPKPIGLYVEVSAGFAFALGFAPIVFGGQIWIRGELHLFIVGIGVSASLTLIMSGNDQLFIAGEICAKVDFVFFSVKGCVGFAIGDHRPELPGPLPLVRRLIFQSRSIATIEGSGVDRPTDAVIDPPILDGKPVVPIDVIVLVEMAGTPAVKAANVTISASPADVTLPPPIPNSKLVPPSIPNKASDPSLDPYWFKNGSTFIRYSITGIRLTKLSGPGSPIDGNMTLGWAGHDGLQFLKLFDAAPTLTPAAVLEQATLQRDLDYYAKYACKDVAPAQPVIWTFDALDLGRAFEGWNVQGEMVPDPPDTIRFSSSPLGLQIISKTTGNALVDSWFDVRAADVVYLDLLTIQTSSFLHNGGEIKAIEAPLWFNPLSEQLTDLQEIAPNLYNDLRAKLTPPLCALEFGVEGLANLVICIVITETRLGILDWLNVDFLDANGKLLSSQAARAHTTVKSLDDPDIGKRLSSTSNGQTLWKKLEAFGKHSEGTWTWISLALIDQNIPIGSACLRLWLSPDQNRPVRPEYGTLYFLFCEGVFRAEYDRVSRDEDIVNDIPGAIKQLQDSEGLIPLLSPDSVYELVVNYQAIEFSEDGRFWPSQTAQSRVLQEEPISQKFTFQTEAKPKITDLSPWIICTAPYPNEDLYFWGQDIRLTFGVSYVLRYFARFGRTLTAEVVPISGRDLIGEAHAKLEQQAQAKLNLRVTQLDTFTGTVNVVPLTPFAQTLDQWTKHKSPDCVEKETPTKLSIKVFENLQLLPDTAYVLTICDGALELYRLPFTTSRYKSPQELAKEVGAAPITHRWVDDADVGRAIRDLTKKLTASDSEFETCLGELSIRKPVVESEITILWTDPADKGPAIPIAVLIETPEPLWRKRLIPEYDNQPSSTENTVQFRPLKLVPKPGLEVVNEIQSQALVRNTSGSKTLIVFNDSPERAVRLRFQNSIYPWFDATISSVTTETGTLLEIPADKFRQAPWERAL